MKDTINDGMKPIVESECSCKKCVSMCEQHPCWGTPKEIRAIIDAGYAEYLMLDWWVGNFTGRKNQGWHDDTFIVCPACVGNEGRRAPQWIFNARCSLLNGDDRCVLHKKELKPLEGRAAGHTNNEKVHERIAKTWDTEEGREVVKLWKRTVEYGK